MSVSAEDAARTLREAERMEARSATLHRYQASTPYFIMWGLITIAAYALTRSLPLRWFLVWGVANSIGFSASFVWGFNRSAFPWRPFAARALVVLACYAAGYLAAALHPRYADALFWSSTALAIGANLLVSRASGRAACGGAGRVWTIFAVTALFYAALLALMSPVRGRSAEAAAPVVIAMVFVLWGLSAGTRYVVAGLALAALTLAGYFTIRGDIGLWTAAILGGSLVLAGIWMRRV